MRICIILLAGLVVATFADRGKTDDLPKRSAELKVLDRFAGSWDLKITIKLADGQEIKRELVSQRRWTLGRTFLQFEDVPSPNEPEAKEFQLLWTYDPVGKNYPAVLMDGASRAQLTGTWDARKTTMHYAGKSADGLTSKGYHRFIGNDRAEAMAVFKDPSGQTVMEIMWAQSRRAQTTKSNERR